MTKYTLVSLMVFRENEQHSDKKDYLGAEIQYNFLVNMLK